VNGVTACLVTRGDQPEKMREIRESLIFDDVIVWDNSTAPFDAKCAGRYFAALGARERHRLLPGRRRHRPARDAASARRQLRARV
jgi:hypothetical protein